MQIAGPIKLPALLPNHTIGEFRLYLFRLPKSDYYVLEKGTVRGSKNVLIRIHSACNIAHIFHSQRCDCQAQLELAMNRINHEGKGIIIYVVAHEGRAVGAFDHMRVYQKQDEGYDTVDSYIQLGLPVDHRDYSEILSILRWYNIQSPIRLLTNNPKKIKAIEEMGYEPFREPLSAKLHAQNESQIRAKIQKLGHLIPIPPDK